MSVDLTDITMEFPGVRALDRVSVTFGFDEVHGLIGENGAGKLDADERSGRHPSADLGANSGRRPPGRVPLDPGCDASGHRPGQPGGQPGPPP